MIRDPGFRGFFRGESTHVDQLRAWNCDPYSKSVISVSRNLVCGAKVGMLPVHNPPNLPIDALRSLRKEKEPRPPDRGIEQTGL
jgi:hypothetical protein